jgi:3-dehydroquinate synthase
MNSISVRHRLGSYSIDSMSASETLLSVPENSVAIIDRNVFELWGNVLPESLPKYVVTPGEGSKCLETYGAIAEYLVNSSLDRNGTIFAIGGGVVGDLAGFVAATYMRGVNWVQIPTTLLAMVDSSVGGKVGIDLHLGKNLLGSFWPPLHVRLAPEFLSTLPKRELQAGMAEVWKYAFIGDLALFQKLRTSGSRTPDDLVEVIEMCILDKARIVEQDEFERTGLRATLNFGHTVGHALETLLKYDGILHGEAISIGMVAETRIAERLGLCSVGLADEIADCLRREDLPVHHSALGSTDKLVMAMASDKKATSGNLAFSLVTEIGKCKLVPGVSEQVVRDVLVS